MDEYLKKIVELFQPRKSVALEDQQDPYPRFQNDVDYFKSNQFIEDLFYPPEKFVKKQIDVTNSDKKTNVDKQNEIVGKLGINKSITDKNITIDPTSGNPVMTDSPNLMAEVDRRVDWDNEYKKAAEEVEKRKQKWVDSQLIASGVNDLTRALTGVDKRYFTEFKIPDMAKDVAEAPLDILKQRDKGILDKTVIEDVVSSNDPNSEESTFARNMYADFFEASGMKSVADQIRKSKFTAKQLEDKFSKFNISNILSQKLASDSKKELKQLTDSMKQDQKKEKEMFSMESKLRADASKEIQKTAMTYEHLEKFKASMAAIKDAIQRGDTTSALDASGVLFQAVRDLQGDNSVVRKSDYDTIIGGLGPINKLKMEFNAALGKGYITPNIYNNLVNAYKSFQKAAKTGAKNVFKPHFTRAQKYGIDPKNIFPEHINKLMQEPTVKKLPDGTYEIEE
ncbi:MAG: hypothetical protein ABIM30_01085 [candidate division WOR-3 bacterium]